MRLRLLPLAFVLVAAPFTSRAGAAPLGHDTPVHSRLGRLEAARAKDAAFWRALEKLDPGAKAVVLLKERIVQVRTAQGRSIITRTNDRWLIAIRDTSGEGSWLHWRLPDAPARRVTDLQASVTDTTGVERKLPGQAFRDEPRAPGVPAYAAARVRAFDLPAAEPPFIIEIRFTTTTDPLEAYEEFVFEESAPVARAVFRLQVPPDLLTPRWQRSVASYRFPSQPARRTVLTSEGTMLQVSWETEDLPPLPAEPLAPPVADTAPLVRFSPALEDSTWELLGNRFYEERFAPESRPAPAIQAIADSIASRSGDLLETAAALYDFVRHRVRPLPGDYRDLGAESPDAEAVLASGAAADRERCALLAALLSARRIPAYPALLRPRESGVADTMVVGLGQFTGCILQIPVDGQVLWLDAGAGENPAGALSASRQFVPALVARPGRTRFVRTPLMSAEDNRMTSWSEIRMTPDGLHIERREEVYGEPARLLRNRIVEEGAPSAARDWIANTCPEAALAESRFGAVDSLYLPLELNTTMTIPLPAAGPGGEFEVRAFDCRRAPDEALVGPPGRMLPVVFGFVSVARDTVLLYAPEDFEIGGIPEDAAVSTDVGTYRSRFQGVTEKVLAIREFGVAEPVIAPEKVMDARSFLERVERAESRRILLTRR